MFQRVRVLSWHGSLAAGIMTGAGDEVIAFPTTNPKLRELESKERDY